MNRLQSQAEQRWGLPAGILNRTVEIESAYRPEVGSGEQRSSAGAIGYYQFMPETARTIGIDPLNVEQATEGAARLWREALDRYDGDIKLAAADYNAGAGVVGAVLRGERGFRPETVNYMARFDDFQPGGGVPPQAPQQPPVEPAPAMQGQLMPMGPPQGSPEDIAAYQQALNAPPAPQRSVLQQLGDMAPMFFEAAGLPGYSKMLMMQQVEERRAERKRRAQAREARLASLYARAFPEDNRPAKVKELEYYAQNPQAFEMAKQLAAAQQPPSYGMTVDPRTGAMYQYSRNQPGVRQMTPGVDPAVQAQQQQTARTRQALTQQSAKEYQELAPQIPQIEREIQTRADIIGRLQSEEIKLPPASLLMKAIDPDRGMLTNWAIENAPDEYRDAIQTIGPIVLQEGARIARANNQSGQITDADAKSALQQAIGQLAADPIAFLQGSINRGMDQVNRYNQLGTELGVVQPQAPSAPGMGPEAQIVPGSSVAQGGGTPLTQEDMQQLQGMTNELLEAIEGL